MNENKKKALKITLDHLVKQFGEGVLFKMSDKSTIIVDSISTGSSSLDRAIGIGGIPKGRIIEILGPQSSGKTTLCYHLMAEVQKDPDAQVAFIDTEHALDTVYAEKIGVNVSNLHIAQPFCCEDALEIIDTLVNSGVFSLIVVDSAAGLSPRLEVEGEMEKQTVGIVAKLLRKACRKITPMLTKTGTTIVFTNHITYKIGVLFGSPETSTGGTAIPFWAAVRIDLRTTKKLMEKDVPFGQTVKAKIIKNKVGPPFRETTFDIIFGEGISIFSDLIDAALDSGVIERTGAWFKYRGNNISQGKEKLIELLKSDTKLFNELKGQL